MAVSSSIFVYLIARTEQDVGKLATMAHPLQVAILEIEINVTQGYSEALNYSNRRYEKHKANWLAFRDNYRKHLAEYKKLVLSPELKALADRIEQAQIEYHELGDKIISMVDQQYENLVKLRARMKAIDHLIDTGLRKSLNKNLPMALEKQESSMNMALYIRQTFTAIEGYLTLQESRLRDDAAKALTNFQRTMETYKRLGLTEEEKRQLKAITVAFASYALPAAEIIDGEDRKHEQLDKFKDAQLRIRSLLNDHVKPLIKQIIINARDNASTTAALSKILLVITIALGAIGCVTAWIIIGAIVESIRKLTKGVEKIGQGNLDYSLDINTRDEIELLADSFNRMASKRKQAEENVRISGEKYRNLFDYANDGIIIFDPESRRVLESNEIAAKRLGYTRDEFFNLKIEDIISSDFDPQTDIPLQSMISGKSIIFERIHKRKDGSQMPVEVSANLFEYSGKKVVQAVIRDITQRKKSEEEQKIASKVFETASEGVIVTDINGYIQFVNPAFSNITGYSIEEVKGVKPKIIQSGRHNKAFYKNMWKELLSVGRWQGELWDRRKNGEVFPVWATISVIRGKDGEPVQYSSVFNDVTNIKKSEEEIKYQAYHDTLTGLPNRQLFLDRLKLAISRSGRITGIFAVLFIDLDNFKNINDSLGHSIGDQLLRGAAIRLINCSREEDTISRLGGDEFTIIIESMNSEQDAISVANRVIKAMAEPFYNEGENLYITVSIGIALYPQDGETPEELIKNADIAMYHVKDYGKNSYKFFNKSMNEKVVNRMKLENKLRKAIDNREMELYYQPKIDIGTGLLSGMEALVRWNSPDGKVVSPADFIPVAEESGLICPLGEIVLSDACKQLKKWQDEGPCALSVSVNASARQFEQKRIIRATREALAISGLGAQFLEIEVTESIVMSDVELSISVMRELNEMGIHLSIDDFGTGYSSLGYLKKFPIKTLKIDRTFIRDILSDDDDKTIAIAVISIGHSMGLKVIAEGVETRKQFDLLRELGCDEVQGYYFDPPVPASKFYDRYIKSSSAYRPIVNSSKDSGL